MCCRPRLRCRHIHRATTDTASRGTHSTWPGRPRRGYRADRSRAQQCVAGGGDRVWVALVRGSSSRGNRVPGRVRRRGRCGTRNRRLVRGALCWPATARSANLSRPIHTDGIGTRGHRRGAVLNVADLRLQPSWLPSLRGPDRGDAAIAARADRDPGP